MALVIFENGPTLVKVKGHAGSQIATLLDLGTSEDQVTWSPRFYHDPVIVGGTYGPSVPVDFQFMLADAIITMNLVYYDQAILEACIQESCAGGSAVGTMPRAGTLMGGQIARFTSGNHFIGLNLTSPVESKPYRFLAAYLTGQPLNYPIGPKRSVVQLNWHAIPYPEGNIFSGSAGIKLWDNTLDT